MMSMIRSVKKLLEICKISKISQSKPETAGKSMVTLKCNLIGEIDCIQKLDFNQKTGRKIVSRKTMSQLKLLV
jgi:hypothetical protein